jgi:hypothetical protein
MERIVKISPSISLSVSGKRATASAWGRNSGSDCGVRDSIQLVLVEGGFQSGGSSPGCP